MSDGGKGSKPRPFSVSQEQFAKNWDSIFGSSKIKSKIDQTDTGEQRVNQLGQLEQFSEGYWHQIENRQ